MKAEIFSVIDDFFILDGKNWQKLPGNKFRIVRNNFVVVKSKNNKALSGPVKLPILLPEGTVIKFEQKDVIIKKYIDTINSSIQHSVSKKFSWESLQKGTIGLDFTDLANTLKLSGEFQNKFTKEITHAITTTLGRTRSYEVTTSAEFLKSLTISTPKDSSSLKNYYLFFPVWKWHYDIYYYSTEILEVTLGRKWTWNFKKFRELDPARELFVKLPIARIEFYEPQNDFFSMQMDPFTPDVTDDEEIKVDIFNELFPNVNIINTLTPLDSLALLSFPISPEEKQSSKEVNRLKPEKKSISKQTAEKIKANWEVSKPPTAKASIFGAKKNAAKKAARKSAFKKSAGESKFSTKAVSKKVTSPKAVYKKAIKKNHSHKNHTSFAKKSVHIKTPRHRR